MKIYCGCCGNETSGDPNWCDRCKAHISPDPSVPPWMRTYQYQHKQDCPYQLTVEQLLAREE